MSRRIQSTLRSIETMLATIRETHRLSLMGSHEIAFHEAEQLLFHRNQMYPDPDAHTHPNGMRFTVADGAGNVIAADIFYSIGGGFILSAAEFANPGGATRREVPYPFSSSAELLRVAAEHNFTIAELVLANEVALLSDPSITRRIDRIVSPLRPGNETHACHCPADT